METYFREFFLEGALDKGTTKPQTFKAALKMIVWGGIYVEALVNSRLRLVLGKMTKKDVYASELWDSLERAKIQEKVAMLGRLLERPEIAIKTVLGRLQLVTSLRNRLVHYKEQGTPVDPDLAMSSDIRVFEKLPPTSIESALSNKNLKKFRSAVESLVRWMGWLQLGNKKDHWKKHLIGDKWVQKHGNPSTDLGPGPGNG
jgi:hypothetical protein